MKCFFAVFLILALVSVKVHAQCNDNECDSGCKSRGNILGKCKGDYLCECLAAPKCDSNECNSGCKSRGNILGGCVNDHLCECIAAPKCDSNECDSGCRSRGNSFGRCKSDSLCECVVIQGQQPNQESTPDIQAAK